VLLVLWCVSSGVSCGPGEKKDHRELNTTLTSYFAISSAFPYMRILLVTLQHQTWDS